MTSFRPISLPVILVILYYINILVLVISPVYTGSTTVIYTVYGYQNPNIYLYTTVYNADREAI